MSKYNKEYYEKNRNKIREKQNEYKKWYKLNFPHKALNDHVKERYGIESNITEEQYWEMFSYFHYTCAYCGCDLTGDRTKDKMTVDHIVPLSQGGTADVWNCIPCCKWCNISKGKKTLLGWLADKDRLNPYQFEFICKYVDYMFDKYNED